MLYLYWCKVRILLIWDIFIFLSQCDHPILVDFANDVSIIADGNVTEYSSGADAVRFRLTRWIQPKNKKNDREKLSTWYRKKYLNFGCYAFWFNQTWSRFGFQKVFVTSLTLHEKYSSFIRCVFSLFFGGDVILINRIRPIVKFGFHAL